MKPVLSQPPHVDWLAGAFSRTPLLRKTTRLADLPGVFADLSGWQHADPQHIVYDVEMLDTPSGSGELFTGVTHLYPGKVGNEYFMTRGHFHALREQGEVYFGLRGEGLLLLQDEQGEMRLEPVSAGSVHVIPGYTAHRLINTGTEILSALAVWSSTAGHDYAALAGGFAWRVVEDSQQVQVREVQNG